MDYLVTPGSGIFRRYDGGNYTAKHVAGQALRSQAVDSFALFRAGCPAAVLQLDALVEMMPEHAHLHVQP
jgi:hypothetical protein